MRIGYWLRFLSIAVSPLNHFLCCWGNLTPSAYNFAWNPSGPLLLQASNKDNMKVRESYRRLYRNINKKNNWHAKFVSHTDCKAPHWDWPWNCDFNHIMPILLIKVAKHRGTHNIVELTDDKLNCKWHSMMMPRYAKTNGLYPLQLLTALRAVKDIWTTQ